MSFSPSLVQFCVMAEVLVGELMFIYPYKKRKYFWVRLPVSFALCLLLATFYPSLNFLSHNINWALRSIVFFVMTVAVYFVCFDIKLKVTLSLCCAGYAIEHIAYQLSNLFHNMPFGEGFASFVLDNHRVVEIVVFVIVYSLFFIFIGRKLTRLDIAKNYNNALNFFAAFVVLVCVIMSIYSSNSDVAVFVSLYAVICCSLALVLQFSIVSITRLNRENENIRRRMEADVVRYESAKDAVELINIKCHDLKKELNSVKDFISDKQYKDIREIINIYDNVSSTGNAVIDTVLMNAMFNMEQSGVTFTFMGNGECLNFMYESDLKSLFMNIISNATEAVVKVDENKRNIAISVDNKGEVVIIRECNYYDGTPITMGVFPETTKTKDADEHGFGLKSMRVVAEKYGGSVVASGKDGIFTLSVILVKDAA